MSAPNDREFVERFAEVTGGRRPTGYVEGWEAYCRPGATAAPASILHFLSPVCVECP